jgi:SAM-dependent methyltransferase
MAELESAGAYWAGRSVGAFSREREWSARLAERIVALQPTDVLEFGCNVGRHLEQLARRGIGATGIDINLDAVYVARAKGLDVLLGDERTLSLFDPESFDVAYTVSVIDHIPEPQTALDELDRIARTLVLVEPWLGFEGKVETTSDGKRANPFLYSWDYAERLPEREWTTEPFPIAPVGAGPDYRLHIGR